MDKTFLIQPESGLVYDWRAIAAHPEGKHEPTMDLVAYKAYYINKIAQARAHGYEPVLVSYSFTTAKVRINEQKCKYICNFSSKSTECL